ncbi:hypothetical protein Bca52824_032637 [Brassica carinata]|uniref:Uncharacterized protein n=1 Tax=Brassica carinata TaxID=52824 RepID=A0A8X7SCT5_BRACI|nr:hypothetical protein Bca52824_032637 [Brassica carinata]
MQIWFGVNLVMLRILIRHHFRDSAPHLWLILILFPFRRVAVCYVTYRTVIHRYCQMGKVDDLVAILEKMMLRRNAGRSIINKTKRVVDTADTMQIWFGVNLVMLRILIRHHFRDSAPHLWLILITCLVDSTLGLGRKRYLCASGGKRLLVVPTKRELVISLIIVTVYSLLWSVGLHFQRDSPNETAVNPNVPHLLHFSFRPLPEKQRRERESERKTSRRHKKWSSDDGGGFSASNRRLYSSLIHRRSFYSSKIDRQSCMDGRLLHFVSCSLTDATSEGLIHFPSY